MGYLCTVVSVLVLVGVVLVVSESLVLMWIRCDYLELFGLRVNDDHMVRMLMHGFFNTLFNNTPSTNNNVHF